MSKAAAGWPGHCVFGAFRLRRNAACGARIFPRFEDRGILQGDR
jgi:hypothetical protein